MKFKKVCLSNFECFGKNQCLDMTKIEWPLLIVGENRDTESAISNGSGKTSFLHGIKWTLFGIKPTKDKSIIRKGEKKVECYVVFDKLGVEYKVSRSATETMHKVTIEMNGNLIGIKGVRDTQQYIEKVIGFDSDFFTNSVILEQGKIGVLFDSGYDDRKRRQVFNGIMGVEIFTLAKKQAEKAIGIVVDKFNDIKREINQKTESVKNSKLLMEYLSSTIKSFKKSQAEKIIEIIDEIKEIQSEVTGCDFELENDQKELNELLKEKNELSSSKDKLVRLKIKRKALRAKKSKLEGDLRVTKSRQFAIESDLNFFNENEVCGYCGNSTDTKSANAKRDSLKHKIDKCVAIRVQQDSELVQINCDLNFLVGTIQSLQQEVQEAENSVNSRILELKGRIKFNKKLRDSASIRISKLLRKQSKVKKRSCNEQELKLEEHKKLVKELLKHIKGLKSDLEKLSKCQLYCEFWKKAFSDKGVSSFLLENVIIELETVTNNFLVELSDGDITISINSTTETRKGDQKERISVSYDIEGVADVRPSGGQSKKITVAGYLGMCEVLHNKFFNTIDFLAIDEGFDGLDSEGTKRAIKLLSGIDGNVIVVSHDTDIKKYFSNIVTFVKEDGVTTIK